jgi:hypothetical protein
MRIVRRIENRAFRLPEKFTKYFLDRGEVAIVIEMFLLNVENERVFGMKKLECSIALVALGDEIFT